MAFNYAVERLVAKLTELTDQSKITWEETVDEKAFLTSVPSFVVTVGRIGSFPEADYYLRVMGQGGKNLRRGDGVQAKQKPSLG
jgi:hypothetical protein